VVGARRRADPVHEHDRVVRVDRRAFVPDDGQVADAEPVLPVHGRAGHADSMGEGARARPTASGLGCLDRSRVPLLSGESTENGPWRTLAEQGQDVSAVLVPTRELITDVPAPRSDHRKHKPPTLREENLIDIRIACADLLWHMGDIKLDGSTATRLEVDEQQAVTGAEEVARMRFAMQQLLGSAAAVDPFTSALQRGEEEMPVGFSERGSLVSVRHEPFSRCGSVKKVGSRDLDASHGRVQALEHVCVSGRRVRARSHHLVVGPHGHGEAVAFEQRTGRAQDVGVALGLLALAQACHDGIPDLFL
jgi:hypothetical protein